MKKTPGVVGLVTKTYSRGLPFVNSLKPFPCNDSVPDHKSELSLSNKYKEERAFKRQKKALA